MDTKGTWGYVRRRLTRLGIPILVYYYLLSPILRFITLRFDNRITMDFMEYCSSNWVRHGFGPLWFAVALLVFEGGYLLWRERFKDRTWPKFSLPNNTQVLLFILGMGLFTFLFRLIWPTYQSLFGLKLGFFPLYVAFFSFGVLARRNGWFENLSTQQANRWFYMALAALATTPVFLILNGIQGHSAYTFMGGLTWQAFIYAMWEPFLCVGINMKLIALYRERYNYTNAFTQYMARNAFTAYIIHVYCIVFAIMIIYNSTLGAIPEIILLCIPVTIVCFLCAGVIRRLPYFDRVL